MEPNNPNENTIGADMIPTYKWDEVIKGEAGLFQRGNNLAMVGGSIQLGGTTNLVQIYNANSSLGLSNTRYDVTNPSGTTFRYTYDGTGQDPSISAATFPIGTVVDVQMANLSSGNKGMFVVTGSGNNYFEVTNASGVAETDKTTGSGYLVKGTTYSKPPNLKYIVLEVQAGGGGGIYSPSANEGAGGAGAGGYSRKIILASDLAGTENIVVGPKGRGSDATFTASIGGRSVFGTFIVAEGGGIGGLSNAIGTGGTSSGGDINIPGGNGTAAMAQTGSGSNYISGGQGGSSFMSGATVSGAGKNYGGGAPGGLAGNGPEGGEGLISITEFFA